ncbi:PLGG1 [Symbiodinium sp. KB8]|nr:PLGG1 [Symbiodinium sp. KB8]
MAWVATVAKFLGSALPANKVKVEVDDAAPPLPGLTPKNAEPYPRPGRPYKRRWLPVYAVIMLAALLCLKLGRQSRLVESAFVMSATLLAFVLGNCAGPTFKALLPPVFVGVFGGWIAIALWAREDDAESFHDVLVSYSTAGGGGTLLSRLLNPLVISLGLLLFERRHLLQRDSRVIVGTALLAAVAGLFGTALLGRVLALPKGFAHSATPRFCTTALALTVASTLNASAPLAAAIVVSSSSVGVVISKPLMGWLKMEGSRERGLSIGGVAHVLGTVSLASWDADAVPYGAVSSVLASGFTAALVAIPAVESALLWILP